MARLAQTDGLTDVQEAILDAVHSFVDKEIIPVAHELEHNDIYQQEIVDGLITIAGAFGGLLAIYGRITADRRLG
jgi:hypothetical protein